jgi:hypothetical protein
MNVGCIRIIYIWAKVKKVLFIIMAKSLRQLNVHVQLGGLNIILYPDRMASTSTVSNPAQIAGAATAQPEELQTPPTVQDFAFGKMLPPNFEIDAPFNTFVYGGLTDQTGFNLLSAPNNQLLAFPFSQNYNNYLKKTDNIKKFSITNTVESDNINPSPHIPSILGSAATATPRLTTYNVWGIMNNSDEFESNEITYYSGNDPVYAPSWTGGTVEQSVDVDNQAAIKITSLNNKPVKLRRMMNLRQCCLYDREATLVYPSNTGIAPTKFNVDDDNNSKIDPRENCSWMATINVQDIGGSNTQQGGSTALKLKWGNLDNYKTAAQNTNFIVYYELIIAQNTNPTLRYWDPILEDLKEIQLRGPSLTTNVFKVIVHYVGNVMLIGFSDNPSDFNVIGSIEPSSVAGQTFTILYHLIPGGRNNSRDDSSIALEINNINCFFKYSSAAFKNVIVNNSIQDSYDFFTDQADEYKKQVQHKFVTSANFHKKISQTNVLTRFFRFSACRLNERLYNTPEYTSWLNSSYFFAAGRMTSQVPRNLASAGWYRDWRCGSEYSDASFKNINPWELKVKILNPNFDSIAADDIAQSSNVNAAVIFDSPVYSPVYHDINTLLMGVEDIDVATTTANSQSSTTLSSSGQLVSSMDDASTALFLDITRASFNDNERGLVVTPIFDFKWGNISDLVKADTITVTHTAQDGTIGASNCSIVLNNLIFSNRGNNILNMIENNLLAITIRAGYDSAADKNPIFFQGIITRARTERSPLGSTTTCDCQDWLSYVLDHSKSLSTFSLQGVRIFDRINLVLRLCGIQRYSEIIDNTSNLLNEDPQYYHNADSHNDDNNYRFSQILNFRQGNATSKVAAQNLSETIDTENSLKPIMQESLEFVTDDKSLAVIYNNIRDGDKVNSAPLVAPFNKVPYRKIVVENRFLPARSTSNTNIKRFRDEMKFLVTPEQIMYAEAGENNKPTYLSGFQLNEIIRGQIDSTHGDMSIDHFHGTIFTPITSTSDVSGLYEGVYLIAVGVGAVPIFHVRTSDSYLIGAGFDNTTKDQKLYETASNRAIIMGTSGVFPIVSNVLDEMDNLPVNSSDKPLLRGLPTWNYGSNRAQRFDWGYVGFRKRYLDDQKQTYIQTPEDLIKRGDLWAQYIRKVPQQINFGVIVTKPLEHYNNFVIKQMNSTIINSGILNYFKTFPEFFEEYSNFLYVSVVYGIDKANNMITAQIQGSPVPKMNPSA